jgi:hypothetical protein
MVNSLKCKVARCIFYYNLFSLRSVCMHVCMYVCDVDGLRQEFFTDELLVMRKVCSIRLVSRPTKWGKKIPLFSSPFRGGVWKT